MSVTLYFYFKWHAYGTDISSHLVFVFVYVSLVSVEAESGDQQGSGENTTSEGYATEKEATLSSTAAGETAAMSV